MADLKYHYDGHGRVTAVEVDGETHELTAADMGSIPGRALGLLRDLQVSVRSTVEQMKDSYKGGAILVDIEATHGGYVNKNNYHYVAAGMKKHADTWTKPYGRPYIVNHDLHEEARGRVERAKFISTGKSTGYHALDVRIGHPEEVEMVLDNRALTVSVGSVPIDTVECSNCSHDLFHDGNTPKRVELEKEPSKDWLKRKAKGIFGFFGLTNADLWDVKEDDDSNWSALCRHMRGQEAPKGGDEFEDIYWFLHGQNYREVSRVNLPADQNDDTGEFAHIRKVLQQTDGLDDETRAKVLIEELSRVDRGAKTRAHFNIVLSENDLFVPDSYTEALRFTKDNGLDMMFDTGIWETVSGMNPRASEDELVKAYFEAEGRFVTPTDTPTLTPTDALELEDPRLFGAWLREQTDLSREDKAALDRLYTKRLIRSKR